VALLADLLFNLGLDQLIEAVVALLTALLADLLFNLGLRSIDRSSGCSTS
jgi:hypothetical protein